MILTITRRELVYIYFQEVFGFAPAFRDIELGRVEKQRTTNYFEFVAGVGSVRYSFYIKSYDNNENRYIVGCYLFGSSICTRLSVLLSNSGYEAERI